MQWHHMGTFAMPFFERLLRMGGSLETAEEPLVSTAVVVIVVGGASRAVA